MDEYHIRVIETLSQIVSVETEDEQDAIDLVKEQYTNEEIVLDETDYDDVEFEVA